MTFIDDIVNMWSKSKMLVAGYSKQFFCLLKLNRTVIQKEMEVVWYFLPFGLNTISWVLAG